MDNELQRITLSSYIKKQIRTRILVCLILLFVGILLISIHDIGNSFTELDKQLYFKCQALSNYIISQALVNNKRAIQIKLNNFTQHKVETCLNCCLINAFKKQC